VSETAFCEQCKGPIEASDRYCPSCGSLQDQVAADQSAHAPSAGPEAPPAVSSVQPDPVAHTPRTRAPEASGDAPPRPATGPGEPGQPTGSQPRRVSLESFSREEQILGGVALLLVIDLLFLPWFEVGVAGFSVSTSATQNPDGWLGVLALLSALAVIADLAIERLSPHIHLPSLRRGHGATRFLLASAAGACVGLKFLFHIHFSLFGAGFWLAAILSVALVLLASRLRHTPVPIGAA
jgi:hypothetical protein